MSATNAGSALGLAAAYWLHMLATVAWIGGLAALAIIVIPAAQRSMEAGAYAAFLGRVQERFQQIGWLSLLVLVGTGMFQMSANPNYGGFLAIGNPWAAAILAKHLVIGGMTLVSAYSTWGLMPQIKRAALLRSMGKELDPADEQRLLRREQNLLRFNLLLSAVVLALTAWARVA